MASVFTCTACAVSFSQPEAHKTHYKLDWHRYNLRRKVAGLGPVEQADFDRRLAAALGPDAPKAEFRGRCQECRKSFRSEGLYKQHLQSKKHKDAVKSAASSATQVGGASIVSAGSSSSTSTSVSAAGATGGGGGETTPAIPPLADAEGAPESTAPAPASTSASARDVAVDSGVKNDMEVQSGGDGEQEEEEGADIAPPRMGPAVCIFCNVEAAGFEENCAHMLREHGFFIPDVEYLTDPEGLVGYVEEKVKLGNICLYCNGKGKTFHTYRALQQHMTDRSHCKLLYDENEDLHEYEMFYDFSASYSDAEKRGLVESSPGLVDEDGAEATAAASDETDEAELDGLQLSRTLGVTDLGELVLLDGKTVGNRKWNRYYKQRLRTADEREVVVAQRRATRLRLGAMYDEEMRKGTSTGGVVSLQRGERKAYGGLSGVSRPKDVKMLRAHQRMEARERLKTGLRQNKLNKTFDRVADM